MTTCPHWKRAMEKQAVVGDGTDADVVAFADDELEAAVSVPCSGGRLAPRLTEKSGDRRFRIQLVEPIPTTVHA